MGARVSALTSWHDDWSGVRVVVLGLGVSGFAAADTLAELGILPVIGVELVVEADEPAAREALLAREPELVIVSPGFAPEHPLVLAAQESGAELWGDVELAWRVNPLHPVEMESEGMYDERAELTPMSADSLERRVASSVGFCRRAKSVSSSRVHIGSEISNTVESSKSWFTGRPSC